MTVSSVSSASSAASSSTSTTNSSGIAGNLSTFLQILTTQLTHQDPTDAADTNQFTEELVQFAQVEQQLNTNSDLGQLINLQKSSGGLTATLNYIGQYAAIQPTSNDIVLQNSSGEIGYDLSAAAQSVNIQIADSSGQVVQTLTGSTNEGLNYVTWDGTNSSGSTEPDGTYTYKITALNSDGTTQTVSSSYTIGKVTGVTSNGDGTFDVWMGGVSATSSNVQAVYGSGGAPAATTTNASS